MIGIERAIQSFLEAKRLELGASEHTVQAYRRDLQSWMKANTQGDTNEQVKEGFVDQITPEEIRSWVQTLTQSGLKPASVTRKLSALRQFFKFCSLEYQIAENPMDGIYSPKPHRRLPKSLPSNDIQTLFSIAAQGLPYSETSDQVRGALVCRDHLLLVLLYGIGLRVSELLALCENSFDATAGTLKVLGKRGKERLVPVPDSILRILDNYLRNARPVLASAPSTRHPEIFISYRGEPLTRQAAWNLIQSLGRAAGLASIPSPHSLRHTFATHLLENGMDLRHLQTLLGHANLSTTQIYTEVTPQHLKETHSLFHPRGQGGSLKPKP